MFRKRLAWVTTRRRLCVAKVRLTSSSSSRAVSARTRAARAPWRERPRRRRASTEARSRPASTRARKSRAISRSTGRAIPAPLSSSVISASSFWRALRARSPRALTSRSRSSASGSSRESARSMTLPQSLPLPSRYRWESAAVTRPASRRARQRSITSRAVPGIEARASRKTLSAASMRRESS